jgi:hypothetical protein
MTQLKAGLTSDKKAKCGSTEDGGGPLQLAKDQRIENPILQRVKDSQMKDLYNEGMIDG